jgi:general L-amino acid transport system permease protein
MRANMFSSWLNTLLTLFAFYLIYLIVPPILGWAILDANWVGTTQADCTKEGACWVFIQQRFGQFMYGYYPTGLRWRVDLTVWLAVIGVAPLFISRFPRKAVYGLSFLVIYPIVAWCLLHGGVFGLQTVATSQWGGLMLTLVIATVGIAGALPLGIVLALGRRSNMPAIRVVCVTFIEFWRGVPLITVLFMSSVMLPLFLPEGMNFDKLLRALIGVILFQSAYVAEVVRGGLQAIPKGQYEAAAAMGTAVERSAGALRITIVQTDDPRAGRLTLVFAERPLQLTNWVVVDGQGATTRVALSEIQNGVAIPAQLFEFREEPTNRN